MTTTGRPEKRRIGIFTSGRQDWWILEPVARAIHEHPALEPTIFVSGTHLLDAFGRSENAVRASGLRCVSVPMRAPGRDDSAAIAAADLAEMAAHLAQALHAHPIDVMVVLGDRIETLMAAVVTVADQRFLAHIHGGDRAPGEFDDAARHAISKLAHVHFPATPEARDRLLRLGEPAGRMHLTGSPSIDGVLAGGLAEPDEARQAVGLRTPEPFVVLLHHPAGLGDTDEAEAARQIAEGIAEAGLPAVCLAPNGDPGRIAIWDTWRDFSRRLNWPIAPNVDRRVFLRLIHDAVALVGNSSAGMVESAAVHAAVLNVGPRQTGREHSANVVDLPPERSAITQALRRLQEDAAWAQSLRSAPCLFGDGQAGRRIADVLASMDLAAQNRIKLNEY